MTSDIFTYSACAAYGMFHCRDCSVHATFGHDGEMVILDHDNDKKTVIQLEPPKPLRRGILYELAVTEFRKYLDPAHSGGINDLGMGPCKAMHH